jgi:hypothetical protein
VSRTQIRLLLFQSGYKKSDYVILGFTIYVHSQCQMVLITNIGSPHANCGVLTRAK